MELAWKWKGYGISVSLVKGEADQRTTSVADEASVAQGLRQPEDQATRDHLLASGSRYVGPVR